MEQKTNKKTLGIIIAIIVILLIVAIIGGIFVFKNENSTGTEWGDVYFKELVRDSQKHTIEYTDDNGEKKSQEDDYYADSKNAKVQFIQVKENTVPMMAVTYEKNNNVNLAVYSARKVEEGHYSTTVSTFPNTTNKDSVNYSIQLLYNLEKQEYVWYIKSEYENREEYSPLSFYLMEDTNQPKSERTYSFTKDEMKIGQTTEDGTPILSKFEQTFIIINDIEDTSISLGDIHNINENELKKSIKVATENYQDINKTIKEEVKVATEAKVTELENKKEQIKIDEEEKAKKEAEEKAKAEEEAKKKAEEEVAKKAQEEANSSFKVGSYTMKYGTYKGTGGFENCNQGAILILKSNGTYTLTDNRGKTKNGTFKPASDGWINFDGGSWTYKAIDNNVLGDVGGYNERFKWSGN